VSDQNGKPLPDVNLLTPNDLRRLRVKLGGRSPQELLTGELEDVFQTLILAYKLREDRDFTWEQAGDVAPAEVFDMSGDAGPPPTPPPESSTSSGGTAGGSSSRKKPTASEPAPSSASTTG
jgi:hypothetical protein